MSFINRKNWIQAYIKTHELIVKKKGKKVREIASTRICIYRGKHTYPRCLLTHTQKKIKMAASSSGVTYHCFDASQFSRFP